MFKNFGDLKKLAEEAILIEHFASMKLITVQADEPAIEVLALMTADDFDVIPVVEGENWIGYIEKKDISSLTDNDRGKCISELQDKLLKPFDKAKFVDLDDKKANSLQMAFEHFNPPANEWFFVGRGEKIEGIVTFEDLGKPAVSLYLLAKLLMVESGLRRLWGTYTNNPTTDSPSRNGVDGDPQYFRDVLDKLETHYKEVKDTDKPNLLNDLGYRKKDLDFMNALRNELAHGRNILSFVNGLKDASNLNKLKEAINRNKKIDELLVAISRLDDNRKQIWKAYEDTFIVKRTLIEDFWVGSNIVDLPPDLLSSAIYVISAENPSGKVLSKGKNEERTNALRDVLNDRLSKNNDGKWKYEEVVGQSPDGKWKQDSFAVGGISEDEARELAKIFGQRAVFEITQEYIRVIPTDPKDKDNSEYIFKNLPRKRE